MRIAAMILGILGGLSCLALGIKWLTDFDKMASTIKLLESYGQSSAEVASSVEKIKNLKIASYLLAFGGGIAVVLSAMVGKLKKATGAFLLIFTVVTAFLAPNSLLATFLVGLAGIFAFFVKPKTKTPATVAA